MNIRILSDLHLEYNSWTYTSVGEDIIVIAGDTAAGQANAQLNKLLAATAPTPTYIIVGNHDFYDCDVTERWAYFRSLEGQYPHVKYLECNYIDFPTFRLCGTALWTDFKLLGIKNQKAAIALAQEHISDFKYTTDHGNELSPQSLIHWNENSRIFLRDQILTSPKPLVIVTHWCPSGELVDPKWKSSPLSPYYNCDMTAYFGDKVPLWIHGHSHSQLDTILHGTRHIRNPKGYAREKIYWNPNLVVTI